MLSPLKFLEKYFYRLWWGLQNLSSYAQSLAISTYIGETLFAVLISILSLVLFAHLIGNMQTYLQSITVRFEEWRLKRRDTEEWMRHRQIPQNLRGLVLGDLSSISGLQLEELMKNQSYMPFLQIFVEISTSPLLGSCSTCSLFLADG